MRQGPYGTKDDPQIPLPECEAVFAKWAGSEWPEKRFAIFEQQCLYVNMLLRHKNTLKESFVAVEGRFSWMDQAEKEFAKLLDGGQDDMFGWIMGLPLDLIPPDLDAHKVLRWLLSTTRLTGQGSSVANGENTTKAVLSAYAKNIQSDGELLPSFPCVQLSR
jgi:hypothetical protein